MTQPLHQKTSTEVLSMKKLCKILVVGALLGFATYRGYSPGPDDPNGTPVPDGGGTLVLLVVAAAGLAGVAHRRLKRPQ